MSNGVPSSVTCIGHKKSDIHKAMRLKAGEGGPPALYPSRDPEAAAVEGCWGHGGRQEGASGDVRRTRARVGSKEGGDVAG